ASKIALSVDASKIKVDQEAVKANAVALSQDKFSSLAANKVTFEAGAVTGLTDGDTTTDALKVTVANGKDASTKTITIDLNDGAKGKDKYSLTPVVITVTKS
ncbi:MAG: hypothetical protein ACTTH7_10035, partial [Treponema sp.]